MQADFSCGGITKYSVFIQCTNVLKSSGLYQPLLHSRSLFVVQLRFTGVFAHSLGMNSLGRKRCSNVSSATLHFVCNKNLQLWGSTISV